jgi:hypothetical protein
MNILLAILRQICGDDCASQRKDLADWAIFV